tara:strand:- start:22 stop:1653 length:1632 start_codon:yes stop_codon:yes gene_type:complete
MGTYSRPGLTRGEEALIDTSGSQLQKELVDFGSNFANAKSNIKLNEEAALTQQMEVYKQAEEIDDPNAAENSIARNLANKLRIQADDLYYTTINSMGEDQTDTLRKEQNIINAVQNLGSDLGVIQLESKKMVDMISNGDAELIGINSDPGARAFYSNMGLYGGAGSSVNGVEPAKIDIKNGNITYSQEYTDTDGKKQVYKYSSNGQSLSRANGGAAPVTMVDKKAVLGGYEGEWGVQVKKYPALVTSITDNRGNKKTVQQTKLYNQQTQEAYNGIVNDEQAIALIDSDDYQTLVFNGFYKPKDGETWNPEKFKDQKRNLQKAKADYLLDTYSKSDRTTQQGGKDVAGNITYNDPKKGGNTGKGSSENKLNHTDFINTLGDIEGEVNIVETATGLPDKIPSSQAGKDAMKNKVYRNEVEYNEDGSENPDFKKVYRFDGEKYIELDGEKDSFADTEETKVRRLAEIKKYLENHPSSKVFTGNNAEVKESDTVNNPDPNKLYRKDGTIAKPTFKEIDFDDLFKGDVLDDLSKMEVALNKALGINPI